MVSWTFDDPPLPAESTNPGTLRSSVFRVYRRLARLREDADKELAVARREKEVAEARLRERIAAVAAPVFHFERSVASLREPLRQASLQAELTRLETMLRMFATVLDGNGVEVRSLDGQPIESLADTIEVLSTVPVPDGIPRIHETVEPMVLVDDAIVRFAKVVAAAPMGAKPAAQE